MKITVRPISTWPKAETRHRKAAPFHRRVQSQGSFGSYGRKAEVSFEDTKELLIRELRALGARSLVLELDITEADLRVTDGWPRATARVHPRVIVSFESKYGPLRYACDTFTRWQDNVRAIASGLEALRKVDRYGVTSKGEQYTGWRALPADTNGFVSAEDAARVIVAEACAGEDRDEDDIADFVDVVLHGSTENRQSWIRDALKNTHPDRGGVVDAFHRVQAARKYLEEDR